MKILLVDDHIVVREGVRRLLSGMSGAELHEASTGEEALAMFRDIRPELVLLDLNLTGIGGLELLRRLLSEDEKVRVVVFSMHAEPIYAARALRLGARGYVSKSAGADELIMAVKKVAEGGRRPPVTLRSWPCGRAGRYCRARPARGHSRSPAPASGRARRAARSSSAPRTPLRAPHVRPRAGPSARRPSA